MGVRIPGDEKKADRLHLGLRYGAAVFVSALTLSYLTAVLAGWVSNSRKLGVTEVVLVVIGGVAASVFVWPDLLRSISSIRLGTLQFDLRELQRGQQDQIQLQQDQFQVLKDMRVVLALLLTEKERKYLEELNKGKPAQHDGDAELRNALRRLRAVGLIKSRHGHTVGEVADGVRRDITELVEITEDGRRYLDRTRDR